MSIPLTCPAPVQDKRFRVRKVRQLGWRSAEAERESVSEGNTATAADTHNCLSGILVNKGQCRPICPD